jgi:hypothetical protein
MEISVSDLIASLDVEEKARAKDGRSKAAQGQTIANMVQKSHGKGKGKGKKTKPQPTTTFKKKKFKECQGCFVCGSTDHWAKKYPHLKGRKPSPEQKTANTVTMAGVETSGYNSLPSVFQYFNLLVGGLILVQMFMCVLMLPCFLLTRLLRILP